jgi:hypothetical protein
LKNNWASRSKSDINTVGPPFVRVEDTAIDFCNVTVRNTTCPARSRATPSIHKTRM